MGVQKKIERVRADTTLTEQEKVWQAIAILARAIDDDEDLGIIASIFGAD